MNSAENVRAWLDARATSGETLNHLGHIDTCEGHTLTETDLEVVLQTYWTMADLLARTGVAGAAP